MKYYLINKEDYEIGIIRNGREIAGSFVKVYEKDDNLFLLPDPDYFQSNFLLPYPSYLDNTELCDTNSMNELKAAMDKIASITDEEFTVVSPDNEHSAMALETLLAIANGKNKPSEIPNRIIAQFIYISVKEYYETQKEFAIPRWGIDYINQSYRLTEPMPENLVDFTPENILKYLNKIAPKKFRLEMSDYGPIYKNIDDMKKQKKR